FHHEALRHLDGGGLVEGIRLSSRRVVATSQGNDRKQEKQRDEGAHAAILDEAKHRAFVFYRVEGGNTSRLPGWLEARLVGMQGVSGFHRLTDRRSPSTMRLADATDPATAGHQR